MRNMMARMTSNMSKTWAAVLLLAATLTAGCDFISGEQLAGVMGGENGPPPVVLSTSPVSGATDVALNASISVTFSTVMDAASITASTFTLTSGPATTPVQGTVAYTNSTAVFLPAAQLATGSTYTATISTGAKSSFGIALAANYAWSFTTGNTATLPVNLGAASFYVILASSGISTTSPTSAMGPSAPPSDISGSMGVSPATASSITGFSLSADPADPFATSPLVSGNVYAANYAPPTPFNLTDAIGDMELAYADAAGRAPNFTELGAGNIGGLTLAPGVYRWGAGLTIPMNVVLTGSATDVWIFQIAQDLNMSSATKIIMEGGALAKNVFWQIGGGVALGTTAHLEGIVLSKRAISTGTGSSIKGRLLSQTEVALNSSTVTQPAP